LLLRAAGRGAKRGAITTGMMVGAELACVLLAVVLLSTSPAGAVPVVTLDPGVIKIVSDGIAPGGTKDYDFFNTYNPSGETIDRMPDFSVVDQANNYNSDGGYSAIEAPGGSAHFTPGIINRLILCMTSGDERYWYNLDSSCSPTLHRVRRLVSTAPITAPLTIWSRSHSIPAQSNRSTSTSSSVSPI
jgi:hypothetical protein